MPGYCNRNTRKRRNLRGSVRREKRRLAWDNGRGDNGVGSKGNREDGTDRIGGVLAGAQKGRKPVVVASEGLRAKLCDLHGGDYIVLSSCP